MIRSAQLNVTLVKRRKIKTVNCPNCGMEIEGEEKVCPLCGFSFDEKTSENDKPFIENVSETDSSSKPVKTKKSKGIVVIVVLIVIIIALAAIITVKFIGKHDNDNVNTIQSVTETQEETTESVTTTLPETTTTTVTTIQTTTKAAASAAETTSKKEQAKENVKSNSDDETFSTYNGGIEYLRINAYVRQKGNEFNISIKWSSGATSYAKYIADGTTDGGGYWNGNMTVFYVSHEGDLVYCDIYSVEEHSLRFYPENNMIMWDDIALTKESDDAEPIIGTVNINDGVLNVRINTDTESEIIGTLNKGDTVTIIEELNNWYLILYNDRIGTVSSEFIKSN